MFLQNMQDKGVDKEITSRYNQVYYHVTENARGEGVYFLLTAGLLAILWNPLVKQPILPWQRADFITQTFLVILISVL